jgi:hypothetical protein
MLTTVYGRGTAIVAASTVQAWWLCKPAGGSHENGHTQVWLALSADAMA